MTDVFEDHESTVSNGGRITTNLRFADDIDGLRREEGLAKLVEKVEGPLSASRDHFQCLLLENFVFWQCSLLIGSASSLECKQSGCGVVYLGYAKSIFWMLFDDQK